MPSLLVLPKMIQTKLTSLPPSVQAELLGVWQAMIKDPEYAWSQVGLRHVFGRALVLGLDVLAKKYGLDAADSAAPAPSRDFEP